MAFPYLAAVPGWSGQASGLADLVQSIAGVVDYARS